MDEKFLKVINELMDHEGGYVNDPDDPGGETKYGISKRSYPQLDIKALTPADAVEIYYKDWWLKYGYGRMNYLDLAGEMLDLGVNMGAKQAAMLLQRASNQTGGRCLDVDGNLGDLSYEAINKSHNPGWLLDRFRVLAIQYYWGLKKPKYLTSWVGRALD